MCCLLGSAGSGFYRTHNNVLVYGAYGQKADMADHDNHHSSNLYADCRRFYVFRTFLFLKKGIVLVTDE